MSHLAHSTPTLASLAPLSARRRPTLSLLANGFAPVTHPAGPVHVIGRDLSAVIVVLWVWGKKKKVAQHAFRLRLEKPFCLMLFAILALQQQGMSVSGCYLQLQTIPQVQALTVFLHT